MIWEFTRSSRIGAGDLPHVINPKGTGIRRSRPVERRVITAVAEKAMVRGGKVRANNLTGVVDASTTRTRIGHVEGSVRSIAVKKPTKRERTAWIVVPRNLARGIDATGGGIVRTGDVDRGKCVVGMRRCRSAQRQGQRQQSAQLSFHRRDPQASWDDFATSPSMAAPCQEINEKQ